VSSPAMLQRPTPAALVIKARLQPDPPAGNGRRAPPPSAPRKRGKGLDARRQRGKGATIAVAQHNQTTSFVCLANR
jgi:hypothetical protein